MFNGGSFLVLTEGGKQTGSELDLKGQVADPTKSLPASCCVSKPVPILYTKVGTTIVPSNKVGNESTELV